MNVSTLLVLLALVLAVLSAVMPVPLWIAVMLLALAHLVGERVFSRGRIRV